MKIDKIRLEIDEIDDKIIELLEERFGLTKEIGSIKKNTKKEILDSCRETFILNKIEKNIYSSEIKEIYLQIMKTSKDSQK